ncbi:hypothetical protein [Halalkalibacter urbisdiaboli]|uniref:hypothetical protein n=1 Tax=Halalkalibacter urbisdiaboli TaxID=1960589 RepID=UPI0013FE4AAE|nr:hypothetical protein [Halalkalibacter urbisdiaboli]
MIARRLHLSAKIEIYHHFFSFIIIFSNLSSFFRNLSSKKAAAHCWCAAAGL